MKRAFHSLITSCYVQFLSNTLQLITIHKKSKRYAADFQILNLSIGSGSCQKEISLTPHVI